MGAVLPVVVLTATGIFTRDDLGQIEWSVLILIAGGISLGAEMKLSGLDRLVVQWPPASGGNELGLLAVLVVGTMAVGMFMSNTAAANLFLPVGFAATSAVGAVGLPAVQVALSIALAASLSMALPVSTPPNAITYARGEFTTRDMARVGLLVGALGALLIIFVGAFALRLCGVLK